MKMKAIFAILVSAAALSGVKAGEWCPPAPDKCPIECCPELGGHIGVGYASDYIFNGVRFSRDVLYGDVSYTFDGLPISPTIGVLHLTELNSGTQASFGDWTQLYASVCLPSLMGVDASLEYRYHLFPTLRGPNGPNGDSFSEVSLHLSKELFAGVSFYYDRAFFSGQTVLSDWFHEFGLTKSFCLTDNIGLDLSGGFGYNDDIWPAFNARTGSGWNHYFVEAAAPIALSCRTTLVPYIGYNGSPDGWKADGVGDPGFIPGANKNDLLYWGVKFGVDF